MLHLRKTSDSLGPSLNAANETIHIGINTGGCAEALALGLDRSGGAYGAYLQGKNHCNVGLSVPLLLNPVGGNVGIGTTSPGQALDVVGNARASGTIMTSNTGANWFGLEPNQGESPAHGSIVNAGLARLAQFQMGSPYTAGFAGALVVGNTNTELANIPTSGLYSTGGGYFGGNVGIGTDPDSPPPRQWC
jgi:hypothetical protein